MPKNSKKTNRLSDKKLTIINDVLIPAHPGTLLHSVLCSLFGNKNELTTWIRLRELTELNFIIYGGDPAWKKFSFIGKKPLKEEEIFKKIKAVINVFCRVGKEYQSYRLHQMGNAIFSFKDGAIARTGGKFIPAQGRRPYNITYRDGTELSSANKKLSYQEYRDILGDNYDESIFEEF